MKAAQGVDAFYGSDTGLMISSSVSRLNRGVKSKKDRKLALICEEARGAFCPHTSSSLDAMQNPLTQECKTGFAVHHALNQFDSGHLSFHLTVIDGEG
jgi:hypothetical protein